jgi:hypothetical protein
MIAGLLRGYSEPGDDEERGRTLCSDSEIAKEFEQKYKTILCRDLLEIDVKHDSPNPSVRTAEYIKLMRPCARFIYDAVIYLDRALLDK